MARRAHFLRAALRVLLLILSALFMGLATVCSKIGCRPLGRRYTEKLWKPTKIKTIRRRCATSTTLARSFFCDIH